MSTNIEKAREHAADNFHTYAIVVHQYLGAGMETVVHCISGFDYAHAIDEAGLMDEFIANPEYFTLEQFERV